MHVKSLRVKACVKIYMQVFCVVFCGNLPYCTQIYARVIAAMPVVCTVQGFSENIAVAETNYQINIINYQYYHCIDRSFVLMLS